MGRGFQVSSVFLVLLFTDAGMSAQGDRAAITLAVDPDKARSADFDHQSAREVIVTREKPRNARS